MSVLPMAPPPKGPLNRYRLLSPSASLRVSPLCLGAMNFGNAWESYMGACDQKTTEEILDFFYDQGGMSDLAVAEVVQRSYVTKNGLSDEENR